MENRTPSFRNISGRSFMIYTFPGKDEVIHYQLQMLVNNSIPYVLKANTVSLDGEIHLQYDITSLVPLKKLLEIRKTGRIEFLELIKNIAAMAEGLEQYLLDTERIVFDSRYIFADPQDLKLEFAYLPVKNAEQDNRTLKNFLLNLIINDIQFANEQSDNFVQKLLELLKTEDFMVSDLRAYIREMGADRQATGPEPVIIKQHVIKPPVTDKEREPVIPPAIPGEKQQVKSQDPAAKPSKVSRLSYPTKSYIIMGSVAGVLILFLITLVATGIISPSNPDSLLSLFGFLLICGAVTYLVYSKTFAPDKKVERKAHDQRAEYVNKAFSVPPSIQGNREIPPVKREIYPDGQEILSPVSEAKQETAASNAVFTYPFNTHKPSAAAVRETMAAKRNMSEASDRGRDKTVVLDGGNLRLPQLKRANGSSFETIILKKFPFILGRLENQADYCIKNPAVGKLHAEIRKTPEGFVITDINSLNGTFVNGERVQPGQDMPIKSGDRIILGNEEFVFYSEK